MNNREGFTLVELLVVIVILGVITGMSIPLIRNIQKGNQDKEYQTYKDSVMQGAKLYVSSYDEDLFGHEKNGCAIITYKQMSEKGLLKDISVSDVSCNSDSTFVKVIKIDGKYGYSTSIGCGNVKGDGKVNVDVLLSDGESGDVSTCSFDAKTIVSFDVTPEPNEDISFKKRNIVLTMTSDTGFQEDYRIHYAFVSKNQKPNNDMANPSIIGDWQLLNIHYMGGNEQKVKMSHGQSITLSSDAVVTPDDITDDVYLVIRIDNLHDITGRNWTMDSNQGKYFYFGSYRVDNTKPSFNDSTILSSANEYHHIKPKLNLKVTDNYSSSSDLRMCIAYDTNTCSTSVSNIKNKVGYEAYRPDLVLAPIQNQYDGSTHRIYVTVGDAAGNYQTKEFSYRLAYQISYFANGGTGTMNPTYCDASTNCVLANNTFSKGCYTYGGWATTANGAVAYNNGITIRNINQSINLYAKWNAVYYTLTFDSNGGSSVANLRYQCGVSRVGALPTPSQPNHTFLGWFTAANGGTQYGGLPSTLSGNLTMYAHWHYNPPPAPSGDGCGCDCGISSRGYRIGCRWNCC